MLQYIPQAPDAVKYFCVTVEQTTRFVLMVKSKFDFLTVFSSYQGSLCVS